MHRSSFARLSRRIVFGALGWMMVTAVSASASASASASTSAAAAPAAAAPTTAAPATAAAPAAGTPGALPAPAADPVAWLEEHLAKVTQGRGQGDESTRLAQLFDVSWRYVLMDLPELATAIGHSEYDDRWTDLSEAAFAGRRRASKAMLAAAESIDRAKLAEKDRLDYDLFLRRARQAVEGDRFPAELMAVSQVSGVQQDSPDLLSRMPARTVAQYQNILARLEGLPRRIDQTLALLQRGLAAGVTPPRVTLRDVPGQFDKVIEEDPAKSPLLVAFYHFPEAIPADDQARLRRKAAAALHDRVLPAFRKLRAYLVDTYVPHARESIGLSALPNGREWYAYNAKVSTTTDLTPEQIHQLGLAEVKRIRAEMDSLIASIGWKGSFADFAQFLRTDPRFFFDRPEDLLVAYRDIAKRIDPGLIKIFGRLPRLPYGVEPVPAYSERSQTTAYYEGGSLAAGQAGTFFANTYDLKSRPKWEMEALTLHEAVPGHHLQLSIAAELEGLPEWRRYDDYTAYVEGWGLYAESLGGELGLYTDPYAKFGQLTYEMWRAIRLVLDTGIHTMGWTREQAIEYFKANSAKTEHDITVEVDRYIVWPGQAVAYKIGQLKIRELRTMAERDLGTRFDERAFHDQVLGNGAVPLDILDARIHAWIAAQAGRGTGR
jgi:uncharacterized protein (DUF885 family)